MKTYNQLLDPSHPHLHKAFVNVLCVPSRRQDCRAIRLGDMAREHKAIPRQMDMGTTT